MIKDNKKKIIEDVMSEFETKHKGHHSDIQHSKCIRDTGYNFDAIISDLEQGGIKNVIEVAKRYWQGTKSNLGAGEQNYAVEVNNLLEQRMLKEDVDKIKLSILIKVINEIVQFGFKEVDKQTRIKNMFYDWNDEMNTIRKIQKCQRVWDHSKTIHPELIDYLLWTAQNAPSKQYEAYYDVYWTADRKVLEELSNYTWGTTHSRNPPSTWKNSQQNANMYMLFVAKEPDTQLNCNADGTLKGNATAARWENAYVSIGIAIGLVMRAASKLGFATGGNKSHNDMNGDDFWEKKLGILDEVNKGEKQIAYGIGIGFPKKGVERYESDQTLLAIGAANGSNLSLDSFKLDKHPRTGKKFRKIKIVDIKTTDKAQDPYGVWHKIPDRADIKINTMRKRDIKAIEIK
jgi:nitroreductase